MTSTAQTSERAHVQRPPRTSSKHRSSTKASLPETFPVEIDVADARFTDPSFWDGRAPGASPDVYLRFEELHPGDPGQQSGVEVRFAQQGRESTLIVDIVGTTRSSTYAHCLGYLDGRELYVFLQRSRELASGNGDGEEMVNAAMLELYPSIDPRRPSGLQLCCDGRVLTAWFGDHCVGAIGAPIAAEFLRRAWTRASIPADKVVSITEGFFRKELLRNADALD